MTDPVELERLSKAADQEDDDVRYYGGPTSTHRPARDAYHAALVQLHRTGQLVPAQPSGDVVEAVKAAIRTHFANDMQAGIVATAAITAYEAVSDVAKMRDKVMSLAKGEIVGMTPGPKATEETMHGFRSGWSSAMGLIRAALGEKP